MSSPTSSGTLPASAYPARRPPVILIWNGLGCLVIPVVILGVILAGAIREFAPNQPWLQLIAVAFTSLCILVLGILLNRRKPVARDEWGDTVTVQEDHSLYWIPVQYWSAIVAVIGVILVFKVK